MSCNEAVAAEATPAADEVVDSVMSASRVFVDVASRSIGNTGHDISLPQYRTLVLLVTRGPQRGRDLAALLCVNPSSATRVVSRLHRAGLVRRVPVKGDRRTHLIAPTKAGRDMVAAVTDRRRREVQRLLDAIPPEFHGALVEGLHALVEASGEPDEHALRESLKQTAPELREPLRPGTVVGVLAMLAILAGISACRPGDEISNLLPCITPAAPAPVTHARPVTAPDPTPPLRHIRVKGWQP